MYNNYLQGGYNYVFYSIGGGLDKVLSLLSNKVDKITGKGLSTNDYTNTDKNIVDGVTSALSGKVDKVNGKGLSTNDYTSTDKGIVDGVTSALSNKADKSNTYTKTEVDNKLSVIGGITSATGVYTTATWTVGSNTCIWNAPATGTYIVWMRFILQDNYQAYKSEYKQLQMLGSATKSIPEELWWDDPNGENIANTISQPVTATQGQNITPYVHTGTAGIKFDVKIIALRIK